MEAGEDEAPDYGVEEDEAPDDGADEDDGRSSAFKLRMQQECAGDRFTMKTPLSKRLNATADDPEFVREYIEERVDRLSKLYVKGSIVFNGWLLYCLDDPMKHQTVEVIVNKGASLFTLILQCMKIGEPHMNGPPIRATIYHQHLETAFDLVRLSVVIVCFPN